MAYSLIFKRGTHDFYFLAEDELIPSGKSFFVSSGMEVGTRYLTVKGALHVRGYVLTKELRVDGGMVQIDGGRIVTKGELP